MTKQKAIIELTGNRFYSNFAASAAARVIEIDAVAELYALATEEIATLPTAKRRAVIWRSGTIKNIV